MIKNESESLHRLRDGDAQVFEVIYSDYYRRLCAFAANYVSICECEEIIQDTMMWLWENRSSLITGMSLRSLLFTIVKNKCLNRISHLRIQQRVHDKLRQKYSCLIDDPDLYTYSEIFTLMTNIIDRLPQPYREAFNMNRFQNLTYNEIAEKMGVSAKTVAYRISHSLVVLREKLSDYMVAPLF